MSMTGSYPKAEILTGPERRRRWSVAEKLEMVAQMWEAGVTVSLVARRCGVSSNQLFTWRRLAEQGTLTATAAEEEVVPTSAFRAQQEQIRELQRLLGKKTLEVEILQEARTVAEDIKKPEIAVVVAAQGRFAMSAVAVTLDVARSHLAARLGQRTAGRSPSAEAVRPCRKRRSWPISRRLSRTCRPNAMLASGPGRDATPWPRAVRPPTASVSIG